jgi:hemerythrin superfamily protein
MAERRDVVELLRRDHHDAQALLSRLDQITDDELEEYFCEVREALVRHEVAEELVVYPAFRRAEPTLEAVAEERIEEQSEAEQRLAELETTEDAGELRHGLDELRRAVLLHAEHEELEVFPKLAEDLDAAARVELGERYSRALDAAPTHPHPHAPDTPPANIVAGPAMAVVDRVRDAMRRAN